MCGCNAAENGANDESGITEEQYFFSIEAIYEKHPNQSAYKSTDAVRRYNDAELLGCDMKIGHEFIAEWHHHHKIQDMGEVDAGQ